MTVGSKIRIIPALIVAAVAGAAALIYMPSFKPADKEEDLKGVTVTVAFTPHVRTLPVKILINVAGDIHNFSTLESPFVRLYPVKTGDKVTVAATQPTGIRLTCEVTQSKGGGGSGLKEIFRAPAGVACAHVVT